MKIHYFAIYLLTSLTIMGCGGGGDSSGPPPTPPTPPSPTPTNQAPTANAGPDIQGDEGAAIVINGSASDSDGTISSYQWTQVSGPQVNANFTNTATPDVLLPLVDSDSIAVLRLKVTDDDGAESSDDVQITIVDTSTPTTTQKGTFENIKGIPYFTETHHGITDESAQFSFEPGESVTFQINDLSIGPVPANTVITARSFVPGVLSAPSNDLTNLIRLLESLDSDDNIENGVNVSSALSNVSNVSVIREVPYPVRDFLFEEDPAVNEILQLSDRTELIDAATALARHGDKLDELAALISPFNWVEESPTSCRNVTNGEVVPFPCIPEYGLGFKPGFLPLFHQVRTTGYIYNLVNTGLVVSTVPSISRLIDMYPSLYSMQDISEYTGKRYVKFIATKNLDKFGVAYVSVVNGPSTTAKKIDLGNPNQSLPDANVCHKIFGEGFVQVNPGTYTYEAEGYLYIPGMGPIPWNGGPDLRGVQIEWSGTFNTDSICTVIDLDEGVISSSSTVLAESYFWESSGGDDPSASGNIVYELTINEAGIYDLKIDSGVDSVLYILNDSGQQLRYDDFNGDRDAQSSVDFGVGTFTVVIATYNEREEGDFTLYIDGPDAEIIRITDPIPGDGPNPGPDPDPNPPGTSNKVQILADTTDFADILDETSENGYIRSLPFFGFTNTGGSTFGLTFYHPCGGVNAPGEDQFECGNSAGYRRSASQYFALDAANGNILKEYQELYTAAYIQALGTTYDDIVITGWELWGIDVPTVERTDGHYVVNNSNIMGQLATTYKDALIDLYNLDNDATINSVPGAISSIRAPSMPPQDFYTASRFYNSEQNTINSSSYSGQGGFATRDYVYTTGGGNLNNLVNNSAYPLSWPLGRVKASVNMENSFFSYETRGDLYKFKEGVGFEMLLTHEQLEDIFDSYDTPFPDSYNAQNRGHFGVTENYIFLGGLRMDHDGSNTCEWFRPISEYYADDSNPAELRNAVNDISNRDGHHVFVEEGDKQFIIYVTSHRAIYGEEDERLDYLIKVDISDCR